MGGGGGAGGGARPPPPRGAEPAPGARAAAPFAATPAAPELPGLASAFALETAAFDRLSGGDRAGRKPRAGLPALTAERGRILLRSLTVPGWGQATLGHRTAAAVFGVAEAGIWTAFTSFRIQQQMRRESYERTAMVLGGISLEGRDEEFRRLLGNYLSSDDYNQYVVYRDAANLYYDDPAAYRAYIEAHVLRGADTWAWNDVSSLLRYRDQRKNAQKAEKRANTALILAFANRLVSALHAARFAGGPEPPPRSWDIEIAPAGGDDATAFRFGVRTRF